MPKTIIEIHVGGIHFPILRSREEWMYSATTTETIRESQQAIDHANHLLIIFPLWLGTMPALLKAFLEQVLRPGFAVGEAKQGQTRTKHLKGRSARIVVTKGMPAFFYRLNYRAHGVKNLERGILKFCGIRPAHDTLIGMVENMSGTKRKKWLERMRRLGGRGR